MSARTVRLDLPSEVIVTELLGGLDAAQALPLALNLLDVHISVPERSLWTPNREPGALLLLREGARVAIRGTTASQVSLPFGLVGGAV